MPATALRPLQLLRRLQIGDQLHLAWHPIGEEAPPPLRMIQTGMNYETYPATMS